MRTGGLRRWQSAPRPRGPQARTLTGLVVETDMMALALITTAPPTNRIGDAIMPMVLIATETTGTRSR
jgi:hypothetical protein